MPTPAAVEPPTPENRHLYRAAALAYRDAWRIEKTHGLKASHHVPLNAAALAVQPLAPEMSFEKAVSFAQKAVAWVGQAHNRWLWS